MRLPTILIVLSIITHFLFFGHPKSVVFDEIYHGNFISDYTRGLYFFDIHPPLARLMIKFIGDFGGASNMDFGSIGSELNSDVILLRLLPLIAGILLPLIIYFICRKLNISKVNSFLAGLLIIFENSLLVQSKFILFDSMLILFGFSSVLLYLIYTKDESRKSLLMYSAILASATFSIKWTGLAFPLFLVILEILRTKNIIKIIKFIAVYAITGAIIYLGIFAIHFSYFSNDIDTGFFKKFIEANIEMYQASATMTSTHLYSSKWYTWPFMARPIFYWQNLDLKQYIYLIGNPFIYWLGTLSMIFLVFYTAIKKRLDKFFTFIILGFIVNFIPFIFIGRVMFLYHYQSALIFSIIAIAFVLDMIKDEKYKKISSYLIIGVCFFTFIYFSPLTYGLHLSDEALTNRMWFSNWR